jgi:hypothetical protein
MASIGAVFVRRTGLARRGFLPSQVAYAARRLAHVEKHRGRPFGEADVARILAELQSPDEVVRAKAVRQVCPCRVSWEVFDHLRKVVQHLQRDPSPLVRAHARHVEEDAKEVRALEALWERGQETEEDADSPMDRTHRRGKRRRCRAIPV